MRTVLVAFAVALAAAPAASAASAESRPLPGGEFVACLVHDLTTPPPQEPHTPMFCQLSESGRARPLDLEAVNDAFCKAQILIHSLRTPPDDPMPVYCVTLPLDAS